MAVVVRMKKTNDQAEPTKVECYFFFLNMGIMDYGVIKYQEQICPIFFSLRFSPPNIYNSSSRLDFGVVLEDMLLVMQSEIILTLSQHYCMNNLLNMPFLN